MHSHSKLRLKQEDGLNSIFVDLLLIVAQQNVHNKANNEGPSGSKMQLVHAWQMILKLH